MVGKNEPRNCREGLPTLAQQQEDVCHRAWVTRSKHVASNWG
jgi:hypothetical protein